MIQRITLGLVVVAAISVQASTPQIRRYSSYAPLEKGQAYGVSITQRGEIVLAPAVNELSDLGEPLAWCLAKDAKGSLFVGTGNAGKLFSVNPDGEASLLFDADDPEIYAVTTSSKGDVYVGTSPSGQIFKISGPGKSELVVDLEDVYVWALALDEDGILYAATGERGNVYKISKQGGAELLFESGEAHIRTMIWSPDGYLLLGSSKSGLIYRLTTRGEAFALYDSPLEEIHSIAVAADGTIFAAAMQRKKTGLVAPEVDRVETPSQTQEQGQEVVLLTQRISLPGLAGAVESAIYSIDPHGTAKEMWHSDSDWVQSIAVVQDRGVVVGTGEQGKVLAVTRDGETSTLVALGAAHVTSLLATADGTILCCTANTAKVFAIGPKVEDAGSYESEVVDATTTAQWGQIEWKTNSAGESEIALFTRSGNTERPNEVWSQWAGPYSAPEGEAIKSPPARFLQWKAKLHRSESVQPPKVSDVSVSYLQNNIAPEISSVNVYPPGDYYESSRTTSENKNGDDGRQLTQHGIRRARPLGKREFRKGYRTVSWLFSDPNNDYLLFDLFFKPVHCKNWRQLQKESDGNYLSWDSHLMSDGVYQIRIVATDVPSNPPHNARVTEKLSEVFTIDNSPPVIEGLHFEKRDNTLHFAVRDEWSRLQRVEYAVNAGEWIAVQSADGIIDSKSEEFKVEVDLTKGTENEIVVRVADELNNVGFGHLEVEVK